MHEKELCVKLVIYKDFTEMHGQQNIKRNECKIVVKQVSSRNSETGVFA
jgi:hypothetical protein